MDLEQEYSPSSRVGGDAGPFMADYVARSAAVRDALGARVLTLPGGTLAVSAGPGAPVLVFIHGGYWQALSAEASLFLAPGGRGTRVVVRGRRVHHRAGRRSARDGARVPAALAEVVAALGDGPLVLAGHSAGAHLAAMMSLAARPPVPWPAPCW